MPLSWNEIKSRALSFSREWADAADEASQAKPFWIAFFEIFGITNKRVATFEHAVKKFGGGQGYVDLFWPGVLLVEQKSRGRNLDRAFEQALDYFPGIRERVLRWKSSGPTRPVRTGANCAGCASSRRSTNWFGVRW